MSSATKTFATAAAMLALLLAVPGAAQAKVDNIWSRWYKEVTNRDKPEIPFAILFSLPAMIFTTPFWLGELTIEELTRDDG